MSLLLLLGVVATVAIGTAFAVASVIRGPLWSPARLAGIAVVMWWAVWVWIWLMGDQASEGHADETPLIVYVIMFTVLPSPVVFIAAYLLGRWRKLGSHTASRPAQQEN